MYTLFKFSTVGLDHQIKNKQIAKQEKKRFPLFMRDLIIK